MIKLTKDAQNAIAWGLFWIAMCGLFVGVVGLIVIGLSFLEKILGLR